MLKEKIEELNKESEKADTDYPARDFISKQLRRLIESSEKGEIALASFTEELQAITKESEEILEYFIINKFN